MLNPVHPGAVLGEEVFPETGHNLSEIAGYIGVTEEYLSSLVESKKRVDAGLAVRLQAAGYGTAELWMRLQVQHDLWIARQDYSGLPVETKLPCENNLVQEETDEERAVGSLDLDDCLVKKIRAAAEENGVPTEDVAARWLEIGMAIEVAPSIRFDQVARALRAEVHHDELTPEEKALWFQLFDETEIT